MSYFSELHAEGPYRTCGEADEARRFYPDEYRMATAKVYHPVRMCLGCGTVPHASYCDACVEWGDCDPADGTPGIDDIAPGSPADPDPAPGRCVNWNS